MSKDLDPVTSLFVHGPDLFKALDEKDSETVEKTAKTLADAFEKDRPSNIANDMTKELIRALIFCSVLHGLSSRGFESGIDALEHIVHKTTATAMRAVQMYESEVSTKADKI